MITITNLSKNFDERMLLNGVSLSIFPNEKIGLTGPNGAGKSTLFSIILGEMQPNGGEVQIQKNLNIGHLAQETHFDSSRTVIEELTQGDSRILALKKEKHELEEANKADSLRYGDILHELEILGVYEIEHKAEKILMGLGFRTSDFSRPVNHLSGGWRMRTLLAKLLTYRYDVLLLDEPTNYLDLPATLWLKDFLRNYQGTFVLISHDKIFLNEVTNYTIVLESGQMTKVKGNYEQYEKTKEQTYQTLQKKQKEIESRRQQLERFVERFHAQPNLASAVRNKRRMIERLETIELPVDKQSIMNFEFPQATHSGHLVLSLENVSKSYKDLQVYKNFDFEITRGQKICLVGPNGAGKSTLLKILAGVLDVDSGERKLGHQVTTGYFSQTRLEVLNPDRQAFEEVASAASGGVPALKVRTLLGLFNFHGDDVFKPVKVLSGGEKTRVILAKLLINPPNFILLDEPTTHLDIDGVEALTHALEVYDGTMCFISHDLFFVKKIANQIVEIDTGRAKIYPGGLDYYLEKKANQDSERTAVEKEKAAQQKSEAKKQKEKTNLVTEKLIRQHKEALKRVADIKKEIQTLETEKKSLETESYVKSRVVSDPLSFRDSDTLKEYGQRLKYIQKRCQEIDTEITRLLQEKEQITRKP